jgi:hypothetical protein
MVVENLFLDCPEAKRKGKAKKVCNVQQEYGLQSNKNFSLLKMADIKKEPLKIISTTLCIMDLKA